MPAIDTFLGIVMRMFWSTDVCYLVLRMLNTKRSSTFRSGA